MILDQSADGHSHRSWATPRKRPLEQSRIHQLRTEEKKRLQDLRSRGMQPLWLLLKQQRPAGSPFDDPGMPSSHALAPQQQLVEVGVGCVSWGW
eukprot:Skav228132  [mRNA]  locus=scaffold1220:488532:496042:+ [translate_table: standard]